MTDAATRLGAAKKRIDLQKDFVTSLMDAIDRGVGQLVDADMNEESTRLQALQVQQQLGIQALRIANSSSQTILRAVPLDRLHPALNIDVAAPIGRGRSFSAYEQLAAYCANRSIG